MPAAARNIREQNVASIASARDGAQQAAEMTRQAAAATQETIRTAVETAARTFQDSAEQIGLATKPMAGRWHRSCDARSALVGHFLPGLGRALCAAFLRLTPSRVSVGFQIR